MDSCDFLVHQPFQEAGPTAAATWVECRSAQNDVTWFNWQNSGQLASLASNIATPFTSHPRGLKRRTSDSSLGQMISLVSSVDDDSIPQQLLHHAGNSIFPPTLPLAAPYCLPVRKFHKGLLSRSSSSIFQALTNEDNPLSFDSPAQSFSDEEIVHPYGSPFSFASPVQTLSIDEAVNPGCGSPSTSITTEDHHYRSTSFSSQYVKREEGNNPYGSPFKSFTSNEQLFSAQSEFPCSDGSTSSEVIGSPDGYNDLNNLMESMLCDLPQVEGCGENHSSAMIQTHISSQNHLQEQHPTYIQALVEPLDCVSTGEDLETQDFNGHLPWAGKSGLSAGIRSLQEAGLWEHQKSDTGIDHTWSHVESFERIEKSSDLVIPRDVIFKQPVSDHSTESKSLRKPTYEESLLDNVQVCNANLNPDNSAQEEVDIFCDNVDEVDHKLGVSKERIADQFSQIKQIEDQPPVLDFQASGLPFGTGASDADYNGIRLVHLLVASAEAVSSRDLDLAAVILARLKELVFRTGNTMQRVASYFSDGLQCRIEGGRALDRTTCSTESYSDILAAFQILHEISPYIKFGHFTANQAIVEAVEGERRVHIIDYEIMEGIQWPSLMQALASREGGAPHLRITALYRAHAKRGLATVQETGKRLSDFASSLNLPFTFSQVRIDNEEDFRPSVLKVIRGEILVVNCMVHLPHMPHRTSSSVSSFLQGIRKLCPAVVTLVEDELGCTTSAFTSHFFEALHHYSAMFDSLEASLSSQTTARTLVERVFFAPRITSTVTFCGSVSNWEAGGSEHSKRNWFSLVSAAGFKPLPLSIHNLCQARLLLGLFKDGFKLDEDCNRLLLGWRCKPLIAASVWNCK